MSCPMNNSSQRLPLNLRYSIIEFGISVYIFQIKGQFCNWIFLFELFCKKLWCNVTYYLASCIFVTLEYLLHYVWTYLLHLYIYIKMSTFRKYIVRVRFFLLAKEISMQIKTYIILWKLSKTDIAKWYKQHKVKFRTKFSQHGYWWPAYVAKRGIK